MLQVLLNPFNCLRFNGVLFESLQFTKETHIGEQTLRGNFPVLFSLLSRRVQLLLWLLVEEDADDLEDAQDVRMERPQCL